MTARIRNLFSIGFTALALVVLATARLPDTPPTPGISTFRTGPEGVATTPASPAWAIRLGLATLLLAGLAVRLRERT